MTDNDVYPPEPKFDFMIKASKNIFSIFNLKQQKVKMQHFREDEL